MRSMAELAAEVARLTERVAALELAAHDLDPSGSRPTEQQPDEPQPDEPQPDEPQPDEPAAGELDTALLRRLQQRAGAEFDNGRQRGSVLYAGAASIDGGSYLWQMERPVPGLLAVDDDLIANTLVAMASPIRVRLLKAVLGGARETHELQTALGGVSTGQLYHHLRELQSVGLVVQHGRGRYEIAPATVVPLLAIIAAVFDLSTGGN